MSASQKLAREIGPSFFKRRPFTLAYPDRRHSWRCHT
jgi:hypothetical protein